MADTEPNDDTTDFDLPEELVVPIPEIIHNNQKWTELRLCEPSVKTINDALAVAKVDASGNIKPEQGLPFLVKLISGHTGLPVGLIEKLKITTVNKAGSYLANFITRGADLPVSKPVPSLKT